MAETVQFTLQKIALTEPADLWDMHNELIDAGWRGSIFAEPDSAAVDATVTRRIEMFAGVNGDRSIRARLGDVVVKIGNSYEAMTAGEYDARYSA